MTHVVYHIVRHEEGWAYKLGETFSETFVDRDDARRAAWRAAVEHQQAGKTVGISYEDSAGNWQQELSDGSDRPIVDVDG